MTTQAEVWHYGLMAEYWAQFSTDAPELHYYRKQIARFGQPVLDLGCGTGRLLVPLLKQGVDIDGVDVSPDMLGHAGARAEREGLVARLYAQPMHSFELPRTYKFIYICGAFGLAGSRQLDQQTLARAYEHLEPGGALMLNLDMEYAFPDVWAYWTAEQRRDLPEPWPEEGQRRRAGDGSEFVSWFRLVELNPLEQSYVRQVRLQKWQGRQIVAEETYSLRGQTYFKNETVDMLRLAGFAHVTVETAYTGAEPTPEDPELVFVAEK